MKMKDVAALIQEQIDIAYRTAYENAAKVARGNQCEGVAHAILKLPIPTVTVIRPETAALHPEKLSPHTIIAGQGLHPVTDEIIDRERLENIASSWPKMPTAEQLAGDVLTPAKIREAQNRSARDHRERIFDGGGR